MMTDKKVKGTYQPMTNTGRKTREKTLFPIFFQSVKSTTLSITPMGLFYNV